jgi:hypothetical protein
MSSNLARLISDIEREASEEGSQAVHELEHFREEFGLAATVIAASLLGASNQVPDLTVDA